MTPRQQLRAKNLAACVGEEAAIQLCEEAAAAMELSTSRASQQNQVSLPPFCYWHSENDKLYFNRNPGAREPFTSIRQGVCLVPGKSSNIILNKDGSPVYECKYCATGKEFTTNSTVCDSCVNGKYQSSNSTASATCKFCELGKHYGDNSTKLSCLNCATGLYQPSRVLFAKCLECDRGRYNSELGGQLALTNEALNVTGW